MAFIGLTDTTFVSGNNDEGGSYEPIPAGIYELMMVDSELKQNSKGTGSYLKCRFQVVSGEYENRLIFVNYNVVHSSDKVRSIALADYSKLCKALGFGEMQNDSDVLRNKVVKGKVEITPGDDKYGPSNTVKTFFPVDDAKPVMPPPSAAQGNSSAAPWARA